MRIFVKLKNALQYPPKVIATKVLLLLKHSSDRLKDVFLDTRFNGDAPSIHSSFIKAEELHLSQISQAAGNYLLDKYLGHEFDLLGSGWIRNSYFSPSPGLEGHHYESKFDFVYDSDGQWLKNILNHNNLASARSIIKLCDGNYEPIDWQKDFKSGYRWNQKTRYTKQPIGHLPGVDVKVPWELSRMHHLVHLAIFASIFKEKQAITLREFRNQVLDFIATNPPRMGVNWVCTMDVGIRAANMLLAYDLLTQIDRDRILDTSFRNVFSKSIFEHGQHIIGNLESSPVFSTNHYLANLAGLLFISAYLEPSAKTDFWLAFSFQEIISEFKKQFYPDGGNFESSTSYHCLSTALITFSTALILGISDERKKSALRRAYYFPIVSPFLKKTHLQEFNLSDPSFFPNWYIERLFRSGKFIGDITKPNDNIAQIGDNDSGKFFKLSPNGALLTNQKAEEYYLNLSGYNEFIGNHQESGLFWDENALNHQPTLALLAALYDGETFRQAINKFPLEHSVIKSLSGNKTFAVPALGQVHFIKSDPPSLENLSFKKDLTIKLRNPSVDLLLDVVARSYEDSGLYVIRSQNVFLLLSAGNNNKNSHLGHAHNDKLSIELNILGNDLVLDPGTYLYTPSMEWRNRFRGVTAHSTLHSGTEQNTWTDDRAGLFALRDESKCTVLGFQKNIISVKLVFKDIVQVRTVEVFSDRINISDRCNVPFDNNLHPFKWFSNGYGRITLFKPDLDAVEINEM